MKRTVLVTGGNRGLGLETCRQLAAAGFRVILTSRGADGRKQADRLGVEHAILDVERPGAIPGPVDVLVNNAGVALDDAARTVGINFFGPMHVTDAFASAKNVVMVSSGMGELSCVSAALRKQLMDPALTREGLVAMMRGFLAGDPGWPSSSYRASKVGLNALTRILARDFPTRRFNAVCPGWVRTDMGGAHAARSVEEGAASIVWAATLGDDGPTGGFFRDGRPIDW